MHSMREDHLSLWCIHFPKSMLKISSRLASIKASSSRRSSEAIFVFTPSVNKKKNSQKVFLKDMSYLQCYFGDSHPQMMMQDQSRLGCFRCSSSPSSCVSSLPFSCFWRCCFAKSCWAYMWPPRRCCWSWPPSPWKKAWIAFPVAQRLLRQWRNNVARVTPPVLVLALGFDWYGWPACCEATLLPGNDPEHRQLRSKLWR